MRPFDEVLELYNHLFRDGDDLVLREVGRTDNVTWGPKENNPPLAKLTWMPQGQPHLPARGLTWDKQTMCSFQGEKNPTNSFELSDFPGFFILKNNLYDAFAGRQEVSRNRTVILTDIFNARYKAPSTNPTPWVKANFQNAINCK